MPNFLKISKKIDQKYYLIRMVKFVRIDYTEKENPHRHGIQEIGILRRTNCSVVIVERASVQPRRNNIILSKLVWSLAC
jgi:hypothetical protein